MLVRGAREPMIAALRTRLWHVTKWVTVAVVSAFIGSYVTAWMSQGAEEEATARWAVTSMLERCPVKDYSELVERKDAFLSVLRRVNNQRQGTPMWREDCTIGIHYSIEVQEMIQFLQRHGVGATTWDPRGSKGK